MESLDGCLTEEQRAVVDAGVAVRQLVTAGPGTGKTHVLHNRLIKLIEHDEISAGEILVLSFSRAAVGEVKRRVRESGGDATRVRVVTFDSLATELLAFDDPDGGWQHASFDERIRLAIDSVDESFDLLADYEHLCVDEVQDLVSVRMRFVMRLLDELDVGFTLFGDPAQAIYDFQLQDGEQRETDGCHAFLRWLRERFADDLIETALTRNFRSGSDRSRRACAVGTLAVADQSAAVREIQSIFDDLPALPGLESLRRPMRDGGRTAVLCRTNGDVLMTSRALWAADVAHGIQGPAAQRSVGSWVARILQRYGGGLIDRSDLAHLLTEVGGPDIDLAWRPLARVARDGRDIDLDRLRHRLAEGIVPDELHEEPNHALTVSTVHRAKGLEFERVVVVDAGWEPPYDDDYLSTLFVALSRARKSLALIERPFFDGGPVLKDGRLDRWYHRGHKPWARIGMEVRPGDIETNAPYCGPDGDSEAIQRQVVEDVEIGHPLSLEFDRMVLGQESYPRYTVKWNAQSLGYTSSAFGCDLARLLEQGRRSWRPPGLIDELRVAALATTVGDPGLTRQHGLGSGGAWMVPVIRGMGRFHWS